MRWSGPLDELRRRYLKQQAELGGEEVILAAGGGEPMAAVELVAAPTRQPPPATAQPKWLRGAPPIPGPGIAVTTADPMLLGNDLANLPTVDAVAERIRTTYCCGLCAARTNAVPGEGNPDARMVLVGEGPGATEDAHRSSVRGPGRQAARRHSRGY